LNLVELSQDFLITLNYFFTSVEKEVMLMKGRSFGEFAHVVVHIGVADWCTAIVLAGECWESGL